MPCFGCGSRCVGVSCGCGTFTIECVSWVSLRLCRLGGDGWVGDNGSHSRCLRKSWGRTIGATFTTGCVPGVGAASTQVLLVNFHLMAYIESLSQAGSEYVWQRGVERF